MAESFAVLGIVANMLQLIDFGSNVLAGSQQLYKSAHGVRDDHRHLALLAENTQALSEKAKAAVNASKRYASTPDGKRIYGIAVECEKLAGTILQTVDEMRLPSNAHFRGLEAFKLTIRGMRKKSGLEELATRMNDLGNRLRAELSDLLEE